MIRKFFLALVAAGALAFSLGAAPATALADDHGRWHHSHYHGRWGGRSLHFHGSLGHHGHGHGHYHRPHYHAPSLHYHQTYHPDYYHWTPGRGWHSHGHYHVTPHYTPGHWHH